MADLLIELICEEIPARMQVRAAQDLEKLMCSALKDAGLPHGSARHFVAPRHLAIYIHIAETHSGQAVLCGRWHAG